MRVGEAFGEYLGQRLETMTLVLEANAAVALLDEQHPLHGAAKRAVRNASSVVMLDVTRTEVFNRLRRHGGPEQLMADLYRRGIRIKAMGNDLALAAMNLRTEHQNKWFPIVDAAVVALALDRGWQVLTAESRWPTIPGVSIETLGGSGNQGPSNEPGTLQVT